MALPEKWEQNFRLSVQVKDGTAIEFTGETQDISGIELSKEDFEGQQMANGGFYRKQANFTDETIKIKVFPTNGVASLEALKQGNTGTTYPAKLSSTHTRNRHQIVLLWCTGLPLSPATAGAVTVDGDAALRLVGRDVQIVDIAYDPSDKELSAEVTFKWTVFDKDSVSNREFDVTDGSTGKTLAAVVDYT